MLFDLLLLTGGGFRKPQMQSAAAVHDDAPAEGEDPGDHRHEGDEEESEPFQETLHMVSVSGSINPAPASISRTVQEPGAMGMIRGGANPSVGHPAHGQAARLSPE